MPEPIDAGTFWTVLGGVVAVGTGALGWVSRANTAAIEELWKARNETHQAVTEVRVLVAGQPTRGEFQAMEQRLISAITERRGHSQGNGD